MATEERDETADWLVPDERRPPTVLELQRQIDVATGIAQAAETAALEIGAASLEAAEQARRAAASAERSAAASLESAQAAAAHVAAPPLAVVPQQVTPPSPQPPPQPASLSVAPPPPEPAPPPRLPVTPLGPSRPSGQPDPFDERMIAFRERAEKVMARLRRLEDAAPVS